FYSLSKPSPISSSLSTSLPAFPIPIQILLPAFVATASGQLPLLCTQPQPRSFFILSKILLLLVKTLQSSRSPWKAAPSVHTLILLVAFPSTSCSVAAQVSSYSQYPIADVLLWRRLGGSLTLLLASTTTWILFERAGYSLLTFVANVLFLIAILFLLAKSASLLNR
ncbi:Reticulon-like protein B11, partial [Linum perenne]